MSIINSQPLIGASGQGGYFLTKSLRFRSSASAYLSRTPASAGNRKTFTWSGWVKKARVGTYNFGLIFCDTGSNSNKNEFSFLDTDKLFFEYISSGSSQSLTTTQVFRDPSAWYHIVLAVDTTQATSSNRVKIYVNGSQITAFDSANYPSQNADMWINSTNAHDIGRGNRNAGALYFDGYMTEINFVDGQALTPSSFGETSTSTGVWIPKKYTGTYGTNGFYLPFTDVATTSGSNAGLGKDFSGNGNYWTTNNISVTSGSTYDSMKDVPTLTDTDTANYAVMNPLSSASGTISNANLTFAGANKGAKGNFALETGKWYWENTITTVGDTGMGVGIIFNDASDGMRDGTVNVTYGVMYQANSNVRKNSSVVANYASYTTGDVIGITYDADTRSITFYKNNTSQGSITADSPTSPYVALIMQPAGTSATVNPNFGQRPFAYTPPTGFKALNTFNLPTPTIGATASSQANKYFDALLYTGNGSASQRTDISWANMQPDMVWIKNRSSANNHVLHDDVRGTNAALQPNLTNATDSPVGFGADGFGFDGVANQLRIFTSDGRYNTNGNAYVTWGWKGSGAAGVTNTAGSITSTVSANTTAGFSIVTWTGNGTAGATVGHGLGVAPSMVIAKRRSAASNWSVSATAIGATKVLFLEQTAAAATDNGPFNSTLPSSTVITLGSSTDTNASGGTFVAYCFAQVAGYSAFGSYTGNGSSDGVFVYTGFRPKFILIKRSDGIAGWKIYNTSGLNYNPINTSLEPHDSGAEATSTNFNMDLLSNGFKLKTTYADFNTNGGTYIYMAFAESPFKYSLGR